MFDLMRACPLLRNHSAAGKIWFGINHEMADFKNDRAKDLDLVVSTGTFQRKGRHVRTLAELSAHYAIRLTDEESAYLDELPPVQEGKIGSVLIALEAKACMTAHQRALPRFYDELNSSHLTVHGASDQAMVTSRVVV
jgi:hypothetical protein